MGEGGIYEGLGNWLRTESISSTVLGNNLNTVISAWKCLRLPCQDSEGEWPSSPEVLVTQSPSIPMGPFLR
jgi:hypothetical protein